MYVSLPQIGNENKMGLQIQLRDKKLMPRARDTFVTSGIQNAKLQNELLGIITVWGGQKA